MKEIRLHGRGGQGVVKAAQTIVQAVVAAGGFAQFIPFFGVERKGSPVYGFLRIADGPIRLKTQVYDPHCLIILDDTLLESVPVFDGLQPGGTVIINSRQQPQSFASNPNVAKIGIVDATAIAAAALGDNMPPNTAMLGAFAKVLDWVDWPELARQITKNFGQKNLESAQRAYASTAVFDCRGGVCHGQD